MKLDMVCPVCKYKGFASKEVWEWTPEHTVKCRSCGEWSNVHDWLLPGVWVKVVEREPKPDTFVLLWNGNWRGVGRLNGSYDSASEPSIARWQDEVTEFIDPAPTHWMALPLPPVD